MLFDPIRTRDQGFGPEMIERLRSQQFKASRPMGNVAASGVEAILTASLVGRQEALLPRLPDYLSWLDGAITAPEAFGSDPDLHLSKLHRARALARWLHSGEAAADDWAAAQQCLDRRWPQAASWNRAELGLVLDVYMGCAVLASDAACAERAASQYETLMGATAKATASADPTKVSTARALGQLLCLQAAGLASFRSEALYQAGRKVLRGHLEADWIGSGQMLQAASWLRIVHSLTEPTLTPLATLLLAYDDMPKVAAPDLPALAAR